ncbi:MULTISPECIES: Cu(I)-responsive transcriptional regulator [Methylomonas]|uniref:Cu(I)-responsive transcriptional regulator n=1 Tax=Methylomonas methanica TaxID=421 RepID=A0A177M6G7_METMH|nr:MULTISPECIES: Cu(I)-responsive transcriptional regulator [Methylomonas]OAI00965.1 Cu(I)-responsive transcriptional regulator [Methylomonas methanica]QPK61441.1 Cu(I)-responsive transcriptional regulator [Methylomonas sp. LL1]
MNISQASKMTGVSAKMIRHYESIGLIRKSVRTVSGYRTYNDTDLQVLRMIKRARGLGFSLDQIRDLVSLWQDPARASADVKALAQSHVDDLNRRIAELTEMRDILARLAQTCSGDNKPYCPIIDTLVLGQ